MIHTTIVCSVTVIAIAMYEMISLNGALAYEKQAAKNLISTTQTKKEIVVDYDFETYSSEIDLSAASKLPDAAKPKYKRMKKSFDTILSNRNSTIVQKYLNLNNKQLVKVKQRIENKMNKLQAMKFKNSKAYNDELARLVAVKELFN